MFGFLRKKKPSNAVDEFIFATYGNPPPSKRANLERATSLAFEELLIGNVEQQSVRVVAEEIYAGPIPFSTHDLALSVAINFFKRPDFMPHLREAQILARIKMLEWLEDKLVVPVIVKNFEEVLHTLYKPAHPTFVPEVKAIKRLVELVERKASTALGPFEDLNRDLGAFIEKNHETCSPMVKMAYAYARRTAMAGLFFQGIVGENVVKHVQDIFQGLQNLTGQTIDFQREASSQADEIVMSYVPRATEEHTRVLVNFAREGVTAIKMANTAGIDFDIDELEEDSVRIDTCIHLIDRVIEVSKTLGMALRSDVNPNSQKRLIDVVEKTSEAKLGAFASMCEDVKLSAPSYRGDSILFPASGYALILGSCGAFAAGGVHPKLISDFSALAKILLTDIGTDPEIHRICREQAIQLASTYVHKLTAASAEVIVEMGLKLHAFIEDGESRLSPEEVVLRANRIARDRAAFHGANVALPKLRFPEFAD